jgi:hypothetical protein
MKCTSSTRAGRRCKRASVDGADFCTQHNPLDDSTCAICLEDIKNPLKLKWCSHVFCKECISQSVLHANVKCPCCRETIDTGTLASCISFKCGKRVADKFFLNVHIAMWPERWYRPWTSKMKRLYFSVYPNQNVV